MTIRREDAERLAEEIMETYGKELGESRSNFCEALMDPDKDDPPMFIDYDAGDLASAAPVMSFEEWKQQQAEKALEEALEEAPEDVTIDSKVIESGRGSKRMLRRILILAATLILVLGLAVVAAEGVKLKKSTLHMEQDTGESTRIIDVDNAEFDVEDFRVTYVPEGYELVEDMVVGGNMKLFEYHSDERGGIQIHISKTNTFGANVDNERSGREEVLINDNQAYMFYDDKTGFVIWQIGDCTLDVSGRISQEELIEIASHIYVD